MLNESQRSSLRIAMLLIEEKMRAIEQRLARPEERGLMFEIRNDVPSRRVDALRSGIPVVYEMIRDLRDRFALPPEHRLTSKEVIKGLPHLWEMLQESGTSRLHRYGPVDPALAPLLDPRIEALAQLMLELEDITLGVRASTSSTGGEERNP